MEQVTLQAINLKNLSRKRNAAKEDASESDGFLQIVDGMLENIKEDGFSLTDIFTKKDEESEVSQNGTLLSMLSELLQSGQNENLSNDILDMFKELTGIESIDDVEIPNIVSKLQQAGFLETMGFKEDSANALYELGNNTYDYIDSQFDVIKDFISERISAKEQAQSFDLSDVVNVGIMTDVKDKNEKSNVSELPITSVSYEKTAADVSVIQPVKGVSVPSMVSQRIVKADENVLANLKGESDSENGADFNSQLNEIAPSILNQSANVSAELPKVENLSNPLFDEFNVSEQITDGIKANLNAEKTEFTVKLNPESLGELTLKIISEEGKMILDISAASESTAKLINSDLTALRESVASMNLEIREATVLPPENVQENNAQFNMTSEQFSEQQRAFHNQRQNDTSTPYYAHQDSYVNETEVHDVAARVRSVADGLDTYV